MTIKLVLAGETLGVPNPDVNLTRAEFPTDYEGMTGLGFMNSEGPGGELMDFSVDATAGEYDVIIRYSNGAGGTGDLFDRPFRLLQDGVDVGGIDQSNTGSWTSWVELRIPVEVDGRAKFSIFRDGENGPNVDAIAFVSRGAEVDFLAEPQIQAPYAQVIELEAAGAVDIFDENGDTARIIWAEERPDIPPEDVGFSGAGYLDMGFEPGDAFEVEVFADQAGAHELTFRYAVGDVIDRPMTLELNGALVNELPFAPTASWGDWADQTVKIVLEAGANTLRLTNVLDRGPNIDFLTVAETTEASFDGQSLRVDIDATAAANGYEADLFDAYGLKDIGATYGWTSEGAAIDPALYPADAIAAAEDGQDARADAVYFTRADYPADLAWEMALADGWYEVALGVEAEAGAAAQVFAEGAAVADWTATEASDTQRVSAVVNVTDGRLTLTGQDAGLQYVEVSRLDDQPGAAETPADISVSLINPRALAGGADGESDLSFKAPTTGVDPTSEIAFELNLPAGAGGLDGASITPATVRVFETETGAAVSVNAATTGGNDALLISPLSDLKANTSYTVVTDGLRSLDDGAGGEVLDASLTFVTAEATSPELSEIAFNDTVMTSELSVSSITLSPDATMLYAVTLMGKLVRWSLDGAGEIIEGSRQEFSPPGFENERMIIGVAFDPEDAGRIWLSSSGGGLQSLQRGESEGYDGSIHILDLTDGPAFDAEVTTYIEGISRTHGGHMANSIAFRENQDPDGPDHLLYLLTGSRTAMGAPDAAWVYRAESALSAAVIEIDPTLDVSGGPLNVQTEADWFATPETALDPLNDPNNPNVYNEDGSVDGYYNPFAEDAPVRVYASGTRNSYDLVAHSNGFLYVPTNGSAGGGSSPDDPSTPEFEGVTRTPTANDYLFRTEEGGYYGHPNPVRGEFIMNGGNPTADADIAETPSYDVGVQPDANYRGFAFDFGKNASPNGVVEYGSDVFGDSFDEALIVAQFSRRDNLIALTPGPDGDIVKDQILRRPDGTEITVQNALDVAVNPVTGQIYVNSYLGRESAAEIILLNPDLGDADADILITGLAEGATDDRLVFNFLEVPNGAEARTTAMIELVNTGTADLVIHNAEIAGPFSIIGDDLDGLTLAAGASQMVTIAFDGASVTPRDTGVDGVVKGALQMRTNDAEDLLVTLDLAAHWQPGGVSGPEPNINEIWDAYGFGNRIDGLPYERGGASDALDTWGLAIPTDETEIFSPYWRVADGETARITQIASYRGPGEFATTIHGEGLAPDTGDVLWSNIGTQSQTLAPEVVSGGDGGLGAPAGGAATVTFAAAELPAAWGGVFGLAADGSSSDPALNGPVATPPSQAELDAVAPGYTVSNGVVRDPSGDVVPTGQTIRFYQALDDAGAVIANTYLAVFDYAGVNYDYNDAMYVLEGVAPASAADVVEDDAYALTAAAYADAGGFATRLATRAEGVLVNDADGAAITSVGDAAPGQWTAGDGGGEFRITATGVVDFRDLAGDLSDGGTTSVTYTAENADGAEQATVTLEVEPQGAAIAVDDAFDFTETAWDATGGLATRIARPSDGTGVLGNDTGLAVTAVNGDAALVGQWIDGDAGGQFRVLANGAVDVRDRAGDLSGLSAGQSVTTSIAYTLDDGPSAAISLTINGEGAAPSLTAQDDAYTVDASAIGANALRLANRFTGVLANDEGDGALTVSAINGDAAAVGQWVDAAGGGEIRVFANGAVEIRDRDGDFDALGPAGAVTSVAYSLIDESGAEDFGDLRIDVFADAVL